jgi:hypothetical protein
MQEQRKAHWRRTFEWLRILKPVPQQRFLLQEDFTLLYLEYYGGNRSRCWIRNYDEQPFERIRIIKTMGIYPYRLGFRNGVLTFIGGLDPTLDEPANMELLDPADFDIHVTRRGKLLYVEPRNIIASPPVVTISSDHRQAGKQ